MVKNILRLEGLFIFLVAVYFYFYNTFINNWLLFIFLLTIPDVSMIGYLINKKIGAIIYNLVHNYVLGLIITFVGFYLESNITISVGVLLIAHVGIDRFLGFGLKYNSNFKDTHLQKV